MKFDWRNNRDFFAGMMYIVLGAVGMWIARDYPFGSALRMGPGYFPTVLGGMMIAFGICRPADGRAQQREDQGQLVDPGADRAAAVDGPVRHPDGGSRVHPRAGRC